MNKTSLTSIALICLVAFSVIYGVATITVSDADNGRLSSQEPVVPPDNGSPYIFDLTAVPLDNGRPYKK